MYLATYKFDNLMIPDYITVIPSRKYLPLLLSFSLWLARGVPVWLPGAGVLGVVPDDPPGSRISR